MGGILRFGSINILYGVIMAFMRPNKPTRVLLKKNQNKINYAMVWR